MSNHTKFIPVRRRSALLQGVSITALVVAASAAPEGAEAAVFHSLNQALALAGHAAQAAVAPVTGVTASRQAALGAQNVTAAATKFRSLAEALARASGTAPTSSPIVVDGYGAGRGLQSAAGAVAGGKLWQGAALPTSTTTGSGITVTVTQNQPLAQLTWKTFNVGTRTTLNFDQSAGKSLAPSWVVINTVTDPNANGSQILGAINAQGKVYVLNRNGIAFTQGATINVGSLIAATADIAASQFATSISGITTFSLYGGAPTVAKDPVSGLTNYYAPTFVNGTGRAITVAPGAVIQTNAPTGTNGGGYVMLLGGNVLNSGIISTPLGQTVLAAGTQFTLRQGTTGSVSSGNTLSTTLGSEVAATNYGTSVFTGTPTINPSNSIYTTGTVDNAGILLADKGDISLVGHALNQSGVILSTTTVNQRGTIHFLTPTDGSDSASSITLAPGSITEIMPEDNGETALDSQRITAISNSATLNAIRASDNNGFPFGSPPLNNTSLLADQIEESRVELSTGGNVDVGNGALVLAQGGQIAIGAGSRVLLENGAQLDVSGTNASVLGNNNSINLDQGAQSGTPTALSASVRDLLVNVQPFQLRDSAANRTGGLKGTNVYVDAATLVEIAGGAYAGNIYTPGGLLEVSGYLGLIPHSIGEWSAIGGQVSLQALQVRIAQSASGSDTVTRVAGSIVTDPGSVINLQGGTVTYKAADLPQTYVQATDGTVYNINSAPGNLVYTGLYGGVVVNHPRWKITDTYSNPLLTPATLMVPGYTVGRDAGSIVIGAGSAAIQGAIDAGVSIGTNQSGARPASVTDPYLLAQTVVPQAGTLEFGNYLTSTLQTFTNPTDIAFQATQGALPGPVSNTGTSSTGTSSTGTSSTGTKAAPLLAVFDAPMLNADGFSSITASTGGNISVTSPIEVATGGTVSLTGMIVDVHASITARAGAITLTDQLGGLPVASDSFIRLTRGAVLDTRGVWTNERIDPTHPAGAAYANGGRVTIAGSHGVTLQAGSRIDVSSGGGILANGTGFSGRGGNVSVTADIPVSLGGQGQDLQPVILQSSFAGYGSAGGGTLSLATAAIQIGIAPVPSFIDTVIDPALFGSGFAKYVVNGTGLLYVLPGTQITAVQPIYQLAGGLAVPTGGDPSSAYSVILPPLYTPVKGGDSLAERGGASISLFAATGGTTSLFPDQNPIFSGGPLSIGAGAAITVDPGQSIALAGYGQVTVLGTLTAHGNGTPGGGITVANLNTSSLVAPSMAPTNYTNSNYQAGVSVWLDSGSVVDVSGERVVQTDSSGRRFGLAAAGGTITIGGLNAASPTIEQLIVRPGARVDADGASATVDVVPGLEPGSLVPSSHPVTLVGNGGAILADSATSLALDGNVSARAGGAGAAGGTLGLTLDVSYLAQSGNVPSYVYQPQQILITQGFVPVINDPDLKPGGIAPADAFGIARASQQQIDAGGFSNVTLTAQGAAILFEGNVALHTAQSLVLSTGILGVSSPNENVTVTSPYVGLYGETNFARSLLATTTITPPNVYSAATLTVQADLLDFSGSFHLGGLHSAGSITDTTTVLAPGDGPPKSNYEPDVIGFAQANFDSTGDIRFLGIDAASGGANNSTLDSNGNLAFRAAQLYPVSGQSVTVVAGQDYLVGNSYPATAGGTITIAGLGGAAPQAPYSIGGMLTFTADSITQAGIVRAPEGTLTFTDSFTGTGTVYSSRITFAPGSDTSVSLDGQTVPYGGTVDGVSYTAPGGGTPAIFQPSLQIEMQDVNVQPGATLDLRGGGTLSGAGFVFGRGGSADVLTTPLLDISGGAQVANQLAQNAILNPTAGTAAAVSTIQPVRTGDLVYAILPFYASAYAPAPGAGDSGYSATKIGQLVTVGNEVPGLAAGTYTLLPAYDALLPGGFRIELTSGALPPLTSLPQGNFTSAAPVTLSVANTTVQAPINTVALFTSGTDVRLLSQYNEESYNQFEAASTTQFGAPRPILPQDAKTLELTYPTVIGTGTALQIQPASLLKDPAAGGYGATLEINFTGLPGGVGTNAITVQGPGDPIVDRSSVLALQSSTLDALDVPRLVLGGILTPDIAAADTIDIQANASAIFILPHATLTAGDIMLTTLPSGEIVMEKGSTLSTLGAGPAAFDSSQGFFFNNGYTGTSANPVLDVSNGQIVFTPNSLPATGAAIQINSGAGLLAGGSLDIVAPGGTNVGIGQANLGAKYASIEVAAINIGSQATLDSLAGQLPQGFNVTPQGLSALLNGNPALGTPAASVLTLTATQEVNILGSVSLDSGTTDLVLNTPAIYGVGKAGDSAIITTPQFTWSGIAAQNPANTNPQLISALPGGQIAAGLTGAPVGTLAIDAGTITLGYGPNTLIDDQVKLARDIVGFANVALNAGAEITANNQGGLAVYARQAELGQPGTGGNLVLSAPLVTTASAAVLDLTAGGTLSLNSPATPSATGTVATLGGQIDLVAGTVDVNTAVALPAGQFNITAQDGITVGAAGAIDLAGRAVHLLDQTVQAPGGTLAFESTAGSIALDTGSRIDVSAVGTYAGSVSFNALAGGVALDGTLLGSAPFGQAGGSFTVIAGTLSTTAQAAQMAAGGSAFSNINAALNTGGFTAQRDFELGTDVGPGGASSTDIVIGNDAAGAALVQASAVKITADLGSIEIAGTLDASGTGPGSITLSALKNLTLDAGAVLDAHATSTAMDSNGQPIDAENRAHVTLTSSTGSLLLGGGTVDLGYPDDNTKLGTPQGQFVLNAPRVGGITAGDVAITASAPITVTGAASIALYAWAPYQALDQHGTILQSNTSTRVVTLDRINADNTAFMSAAGANTALTARLAGLIAAGGANGAGFNLRPGVEIDSNSLSGGTLTIGGDLDLSGLRYSDMGYGTKFDSTVDGSGEAGSILFRASGDLVVNGSVTDGFTAPDKSAHNYIKADNEWIIVAPNSSAGTGLANPLSADVILPSSLTVKTVDSSGSTITVHNVELGAGTTFDETRAISLNYAITVNSANIAPNTVIPFAATIDPNSAGVTIPAGGFVTTSAITEPTGTVIPAGTFLPAGTLIPPGSGFAAGADFPNQAPSGSTPQGVQVATDTVVPPHTLLSIFDDSTLTLSQATARLPDNALIPSNTVPQFLTPDGTFVPKLELRPVGMDGKGNPVQGYLYALSALLPAGSQSWNLDFVAGANTKSADVNAVLPRSVLDGGALASQPNTPNAAPGSLILDDEHYIADPGNQSFVNPAFSVIRTGTGDLSLVAGGNFDQSSLYGIYTAGTQAPLDGGDAAANAPYNLARENFINTTTGQPNHYGVTPGGRASALNRLAAESYQANYPTDGGDVLLSAQGSVLGDVFGGINAPNNTLPVSDSVGNWLWRQGSTQLGQAPAWWINFGTFSPGFAANESGYVGSPAAQLVGFQGLGALGGGNVTVSAGQDAGQTTNKQGGASSNPNGNAPLRGEGLVIAVASTGRVVSANGTQSLIETGGGNLTLRVAGTLNPLDAMASGTTGGQSDLNGVLIDLRGNISTRAGAVGRIDEQPSSAEGTNEPDPRPISLTNTLLLPSDGVTIVPGDGSTSIITQRDAVLDGVGDAGRVTEQNLTALPQAQVGSLSTVGGATGFTLWTANTSVSVFSAGGNVAPITVTGSPFPQDSIGNQGPAAISNDGATDNRFVYPSQLYVTSAAGNIVYGSPDQVSGGQGAPVGNLYSLEVAPSSNEQVAFLAGRSIQSNGMAVDLSGADPAGLSTPFNPAFNSNEQVAAGGELTNIRTGAGTEQSILALFALEPDTPTINYLGQKAANAPALFYAANGDLLNFVSGETLIFKTGETLPEWYLAAKPVRIVASNDIVNSGTRPTTGGSSLKQNAQNTPSGSSVASGNLFLNNTPQSISVVSAGRDILSGYFYVGGPGLLEVDAGRNIQQVGYSVGTTQLLSYGSIKSIGSLLTGAPISLTGGASIEVSAGLGTGADYTAFANLYLNPANQANLALQITDPANKGKVQEVYAAQLLSWLQANYGYTGTQADALAYFLNPANVPLVNQAAFLRGIFYSELLASGQQYNDPASRFFKSYTRGRTAIDALLPGINGQTTTNGAPAGYNGAITMASGTLSTVTGLFDAGVATERGGDIQVLDPGGQIVLGTTGATFPGGGTGLVTNGFGNIDVFSDGSVLLGKSRIFTNAGGNIQIWSAVGDINAGIGARTSVVFNPPVISYDNAGGLVETPAVPTSGSGIATNQPLPSIPIGNIDLTAPLGTIDAGEAGVRSSGNLNLAAARLANTSGFSAGGKTTGNNAAPTVSIGAVEAAGAAAGAAQQSAQNVGGNRTAEQNPSVIDVEVISISGESEEERRKKRGM